MTTVSEAIVSELEAAGVQTVFGLPGVHNLALFEALDRSAIRTVVVRHEATAGYAADALGRLTGRPAVCVTTSGPGAVNAATAMGEAQAARSPLVHLTTTVPRRHLGAHESRGVLHEHPRQREIFAPLAKSAVHAGDPGSAARAVGAALQLAQAPPHGPAYVEIPTDVLAEPAPSPPAEAGGDRSDVFGGENRWLRALADRLAAARRPVIWVGSGGCDAAPSIERLADRLGAPIVLTYGARRRWTGAGDGHVLVHPPHEPVVTELLASADATLVVGSDLDAMMTQEFRLPLPGLHRVDVVPERDDAPYRAELFVQGDAVEVIEALGSLVGEREGGDPGVVAIDARAAAGLDAEEEFAGALGYLRALDAALADRAVAVVCDMAISGYWASGYLPLRATRRIVYPMGWGTLGFGLPASVGAALAPGIERAVCVCGDGGALFAVGELATIAQERLPVTVVVNDDGGYGMLRFDEQRRYGRSFAVDLSPPDFAAVAEAFGIPARRVGLEDAQLGDALADAVAADGPSLLVVSGPLSPPRTTSRRWPLA